MEEKKKEEAAPIFMVTVAPGFFDGSKMNEPGTKIAWVVPEDWDDKKNGKHWAQHAPSATFRPMNPEAEALVEKIAKDRAAKKK